jgi:isoleucyl-tRNA synthetase
MEEFVELLSNWYVRRSRRRFWKSESDQDKLSAYGTLYASLNTFIRLLAPFVPFLAEEMYQNLVRSVDGQAVESVHLTDFPVADDSLIDAELSDAMRLAMRVSSLGRAARQKAQVRVRQPLERVLVAARGPGDADSLHGPLREQVLDELNVHDVAEMGDTDLAGFLTFKPNLTLLGPKLGERVGDVTAALQAAPPEARVAALAGEQIEVGGFTLEPEEVQVGITDVEGYAVAREGSCLVAIDTRLTDELRDEGLARELVHRIQNMRRSAEFDIADRIVTWCVGDERVWSVMERHGDYVRQETLSLELRRGEPDADAYVEEHTVDGAAVKLGVRRA